MTARIRPLVRISLAAAVCAGLGWLALSEGLATQAMHAGKPEVAARWRPSSPGANAALAEAELRRGRVKRARDRAMCVLATAPSNVAAMRVAGLAEERLGTPEQAARLMAQAAKWSWRDTQTQMWLFQRTLLDGNFPAAMQHGDALARRAKERPLVYALMTAATAATAATPALIARLEEPSNWRLDFFRSLQSVRPEAVPGIVRLFEQLKGSALPPTRTEARDFLYRMIEFDPAGARQLWDRLFADGAVRRIVTDGRFDRTDPTSPDYRAPTPFDWWFPPTTQGYVDVTASPRSETDKAMHITYSGTDGALPIAQQIIVLPPGSYTLSARVAAEREDALRDVPIDVMCGKSATALSTAGTPLVRAGSEWQTITRRFTVPANGCPYQTIAIRALPRDEARDIILWFDDVSVAQAEPGAVASIQRSAPSSPSAVSTPLQ